ncbi:hypothetical protein IZU99_04735 [Oscillospiraceae bacterium CM]|nr:hypothetical protein IZU99_04735 [Oscillospiraceae bacterium CM]
MIKIIKKGLIFLILLIIVVTAGVLLEIFVIDPLGKSSTPSPSVAVTGYTTPSEEPPVTAAGKAFTVTSKDPAISCTVTVDDAMFEVTTADGGYIFRLLADKNAYLKLYFIQDANAASIAPGFLNAYIDFKNFSNSGDNYIDGTEISGQTVTADDGTTEVTAWLVNTDAGVLAVVTSLSLEHQDAERALLGQLLKTLSLSAA